MSCRTDFPPLYLSPVRTSGAISFSPRMGAWSLDKPHWGRALRFCPQVSVGSQKAFRSEELPDDLARVAVFSVHGIVQAAHLFSREASSQLF